MGKVKISNIKSGIIRYKEAKDALQAVLTCSNEQSTDRYIEEVCQTEKELEEAFANLLFLAPVNLPSVLSKCQLFITEIMSDAELTQYQVLALQCIIDDLNSLIKRTNCSPKYQLSPVNEERLRPKGHA